MTSPEIKKSVPTNHGIEYHELTTEYIIIIHDEAIESFGGEKGFLSISSVLLKIAKYECTLEDIIGWLKKNVSPLHMS